MDQQQPKRYLITHGLRYIGVNPSHTPEGDTQLSRLQNLTGFNIARVVIGTGIRFQEIYSALIDEEKLSGKIPVMFSPFCGSADGLDPPNGIVLADGRKCTLGKDYIGLADTKAFDPWAFIAEQPEGTLFLAGGELAAALGIVKPAKAALYELDFTAKKSVYIV